MSNMLILNINGRKYGMRKMPPLQGAAFGLKVATLVSKFLASPTALPVLQSLQKKFGNAANISGEETLGVGASLISLLSGVDAKELESVFREAMSFEVYFDSVKLSDPVEFETHFSKYPGDLYVVEAWATYNHVKDFFSGLGDGIKALMPSTAPSSVDQE